MVQTLLALEHGSETGHERTTCDASRRECAEEAFQYPEQRYRLLFEQNQAGVYHTTTAGQVLDCNQAFARILGYDAPAEVLGHTAFDLYFESADRESFIAQLAAHDAVTNLETRLRRRDGQPVWVIENANLIRDAQGQPAMIQGTLIDITERREAEKALRKRTAQLEALRQIDLELAAELGLENLLRSIVSHAARLADANSGGIYLYQPEQDALVRQVSLGNRPLPLGTVRRRGEGLSGKVWEIGRPLSVDDYRRWEGRASGSREPRVAAVMAAPVRWGDEFLGVLTVSALPDTRLPFSPADTELLSLFATQAAIAIHNARLFEAERAARQRAEKLQAATQALSATLDLQQVFELILTELQHVVPYDSASVQQLKDNRLEIIGGHGFPNLKELLGQSFDLTAQDNPNREVVRTRAPLILDDAPALYENFRHAPHAQAGIRAWLGVPLLFGDQLIGLIALDKREPGFYTGEHARLALAFAAQAAIAIENARLYREAVRAAERRAVLHQASQEIVRLLHDPEQVYQAVHRAAAQLMPAEAFVIALRDKVRGEDEAVYLIDQGGRWPPRRSPAGQGLSGQIIDSGQSLLLDDFSFETIPQATHFGGPEHVRSILAVPLRLGEKTSGMISAQSYQPRAYTADDQVLLEMLAAHTAAVLDNARLYQEAQRRLKDLTLLFQTSVAVSESLDVDTVLHTTARQIAEALGVEGCALSAWDREQDDLVTLLDHSPDPGHWAPVAPGTRYSLAQLPASRRVLTSRQPLAVRLNDPDADPTEVQWMREEEILSLLMVPLVIGDQVIGLLELMEGQRERAFTPTEIGLCQTLANQAAAALENARLYDEARRRNRELALLNRVIAASAASLDIEPMLEAICQELVRAFDVPRAVATLFDKERSQALVVVEVRPEERPSLLGLTIPIPDELLISYLDRQQPVIVDDAQTDPRLEPIRGLVRRLDTASLLIVPLYVAETTIGALLLGTSEPRSFQAKEVEMARRVADQVSGALARARLSEAERRLSTAVEQSPESILITDAAGTIVYVNPAFERVTGYSRAEALGQTPRLLKSGRHDAAFYHDLWQTIRAEQVWQGRFINKKRDGCLFTEDATITPVRNQAGEIVHYVATMRDVTREVELEDQVRQAQKLEAVGRLAGGVAHDFNNLLTVVHLSARLMEQKLHPEDQLWKHVQRIQDVAERAARLTKQLLGFSRRQMVTPRVLDLNTVVSDMDGMLRRLIGEDIDLQTSQSDNLWPVQIDPSQMEQILVNLVVNARDAMPRGGIVLVDTANVVLNQASAARHLDMQPGEYVLLAVSDTGMGMGEEVKAHLFEPFFTTKEVGKGTGLGLANVFGIVKQNGGHIEVYSEVGQGTTFEIYLPRTEAKAEAEVKIESPTSASASASTSTILLVEDEAGVRDLAEQILEAHGYRVLAAQDGPDALYLSEQHCGPIHLLLTDVVMPGMSGKELADRLCPQRPELRILYMSGYTDNAIVHHGVLEPGIAFLAKSLTEDRLLRKVRAVLAASD